MIEEDDLDEYKKYHPVLQPADYETAILATEYGWFNYALIFMTIPCGLTIVFVTTSLSLAMPAAQCDLKLTTFDKGLLNSGVFIGIIATAFLWGYLADTLGRKKLLIFSYFCTAIFNLATVFTHQTWYLMMFKVLDGAMISGPFSILMTYVSEFHGKKHRDRAVLNVARSLSFGQLALPLIAYFILPHQWRIVIVENIIELSNWQIFFFACSIPTILSFIIVCFFPESPKFLMSRGRNKEALIILKKVFSVNTGRPKSQYPIRVLINELDVKSNPELEQHATNTQKSSGFNAVKQGWNQVIPLFHKPHLAKACLVFAIQFLLLLGFNTFRLWVPQIFAIFNEYEKRLAMNQTNADESLCSLIEADVLKSKLLYVNESSDVECNANFTGDNYLQSVYIGIVIVVVFTLAAYIVKYTGNRLLLIPCLLISGISAILLFWVKSTLSTMILASMIISLEMLCASAITSICLAVFPTSIRTMAVSIGIMMGRIGSVVGNVAIPLLLNYGCLPPFILISLVALVTGFLSIFLPDTKNKSLQ